jgi:CRP/FNR family transcriptional regulator
MLLSILLETVLMRMVWRVRIGLSHSVFERFARFLLETAADGEVSHGTVRVRLAMTHEEISQLVGTSRETITRQLSEFRN